LRFKETDCNNGFTKGKKYPVLNQKNQVHTHPMISNSMGQIFRWWNVRHIYDTDRIVTALTVSHLRAPSSDNSIYIISNICILWYYQDFLQNAGFCHGSGDYSPVSYEAGRVRFQAFPCRICGSGSGTGIGFSPRTYVYPFNIIPSIIHVY
jgi:hypothetical protein